MKALVLCAGKGTRLGALCVDRPKPLLDVGGNAIVEHILVRLARHGFDEVFLNLHHHADAFPAHLGDGARFGVRIQYLHEPAPLGTGGTSRNLLARLAGEDLLVHYGDILTEHDLGAFVNAHHRSGALATALLHQRAGSNSHARLDDGDRIVSFVERPHEAPRNDA
ncbi:MAG TPA: nucleotidyltransferase family protein, partial [Polyangia bacterium]